MNKIIENLNDFIEKYNCDVNIEINTICIICNENYDSSEIVDFKNLLKENEELFLLIDNRFLPEAKIFNSFINQKSKISLSKKNLTKYNTFFPKTQKDYIKNDLKNGLVNFDKERYILNIEKKQFENSKNSFVSNEENKYLIYKYIYSLADMCDELNAFYILKKPVKITEISINPDSFFEIKIDIKIDDVIKYFSEDYEKKRACFKKALISISNKYPSNKFTNEMVLSEFENIFLNTKLNFDRYIASHVQDKLALEIKKNSMKIVKSINEANDNINSAVIAMAANAIILINFKFEGGNIFQNIIFLIILLCISILEIFICSNNISALGFTKKAMETAKEKMLKKYPNKEDKIKTGFIEHEKKRKLLSIEFIVIIIGICLLFAIITSYFFYNLVIISIPKIKIEISTFF